MSTWWRLLITFICIELLHTLLRLATDALLPPSIDRSLAGALIRLPNLIIAFLFYYHLPTLLGKPMPLLQMKLRGTSRSEQPWLAGWWWKWALLSAASLLDFLRDVSSTFMIWNSLNSATTPMGGFPARLTPGTRRIFLGFDQWSGLASILELLFLSTAIYLFWRDWRTPKRALQGFCKRCGYDLTGNVSGVCPECGVKR